MNGLFTRESYSGRSHEPSRRSSTRFLSYDPGAEKSSRGAEKAAVAPVAASMGATRCHTVALSSPLSAGCWEWKRWSDDPLQ